MVLPRLSGSDHFCVAGLGEGVLNEEGHHSSDQSVTPNSNLSAAVTKMGNSLNGPVLWQLRSRQD